MPLTGSQSAAGSSGRGRAGRSRLTADDFAVRFESSARLLWTIAAGVLGDRSSVEDVLQEAALIGLGKLGDFDPTTSFNAWMGRVVRFVALNQLRLQRRRRTSPTDPDALDLERAPADLRPPRIGPKGELAADSGHFDDDLDGALRELRPVARACLLLKTIMGLEYQEIGETLGIPPGTAMSHVHRARQHLRTRLAGPSPARASGTVRER